MQKRIPLLDSFPAHLNSLYYNQDTISKRGSRISAILNLLKFTILQSVCILQRINIIRTISNVNRDRDRNKADRINQQSITHLLL